MDNVDDRKKTNDRINILRTLNVDSSYSVNEENGFNAEFKKLKLTKDIINNTPKGINNFGYTCFMNTAIQVMLIC
jgi:ubiquitin C-terminal hydrolase